MKVIRWFFVAGLVLAPPAVADEDDDFRKAAAEARRSAEAALADDDIDKAAYYIRRVENFSSVAAAKDLRRKYEEAGGKVYWDGWTNQTDGVRQLVDDVQGQPLPHDLDTAHTVAAIGSMLSLIVCRLRLLRGVIGGDTDADLLIAPHNRLTSRRPLPGVEDMIITVSDNAEG